MVQKTRKIYVFQCDACDTIEEGENPKGWKKFIMHLRKLGDGGEVLISSDLDLCDDCWKKLRVALDTLGINPAKERKQ